MEYDEIRHACVGCEPPPVIQLPDPWPPFEPAPTEPPEAAAATRRVQRR